MIPRLKEQYNKKIVVDLQKKFSMKNKLMVPRIKKVVLNMGLGPDSNDKKIVQNCIEDITLISGQRAVITKFKKSISNFKTRKGTTAGIKVTLRSNKMYEFIDRLVNIALPRIKDFQGLNVNGFDNFGNYSFGIKEHIIFPEINFDKVDRIRGMDITLVITGKDKKKEGEIIEIDRINNRAKVKDINMVKKHVKTTKEKKGGIVSKENFIHISNLKLIDEKIKNKKTEAKK